MWMYSFILRNVLGLLSTLFAASNISLWVWKFRLSHGSLRSRHLLIMISPETPYKFMPNAFYKVMNPVYPRKEGQCLYLPHLPWAQLICPHVFFLTSAINRQTAKSNTSRCTAVRETQWMPFSFHFSDSEKKWTHLWYAHSEWIRRQKDTDLNQGVELSNMHRDTSPVEKEVTAYTFCNTVEKAKTVAMGLVRILGVKCQMCIHTDMKNFEN